MKCPNCGQEFEGDRCPNCGRPVSRRGSRIAAIVLFVLLAVPLAAIGTCSVVVGVGGLLQGGDTAVYSVFPLLVGGAVLILFVAVLFGVRSLWKG